MKLEKLIAFRYLKSKHKINFITIISFLSILGITVGVAALIVVLSVFNGFAGIVTDILVSFDPHIKIESNIPEGFTPNTQLEKFLEQNDKVQSFSPIVYGKSVIYSKRVIRIINLYGIGEDEKHQITGLKNNIVVGSYDLASIGLPKALVGLSLANRLQVSVGDTIIVVSPEGLESYLAGVSAPVSQAFVISGIYNSHNVDVDAYNVYVPLKSAQKLLGYGKNVFGYEIRLNDIRNSYEMRDEIKNLLNSNIYSVKTWFDLHKDLYSVMLIERWAAYIILSLIIAVATFSIFSSLMLTVLEKKRDIGVLKAMGMTQKSLLNIFLFEAILIGIIGSILGVVIGVAICFLQINYKLYPLDPNIYIIDALPLKIQILDIVLIVLMAVILSTIAGYFPARKASKQNPLEAIRWE